jgi:hypothetical protein
MPDQVTELTMLSEEEVAARAKTLSDTILQCSMAQDDLRAHNAIKREELKGLQATIKELAEQVRTRSVKTLVDRQPGLFDGTVAQADADDGESGDGSDEPDPDDDELSGAGAGWTEGSNPQPIMPEDDEPPPGTEITDPAALAGAEEPPKRRRGRKNASEVTP